MKKNIKRILIVLSLACVVSLGTTYALMSSKSQTAVNTFSSSKNIKIDLREPKWDGYTFNEDLPTTPGVNTKVEDQNSLGIIQAGMYQPGDIIQKNPTIQNNSNNNNAYVALKVEFIDDTDNIINKETFEKKYGVIKGVRENIIVKDYDTYSLFIYNNKLESSLVNTDTSKTQVEFFQTVELNKNIDIKEDKLPTFMIKATGYATQSNIGLDMATNELIELAQQKETKNRRI